MSTDKLMDAMEAKFKKKRDELDAEWEAAFGPKFDAIAKLRESTENGTFTTHPDADMFPMIEGKEREELMQSIKENGIKQKIAIDKKGRVVDGRNRMSCLLELRAAGAEIASPHIELISDKDVEVYVMSANIHRRHLTPKQRAIIIALTTEPMSRSESAKKARATQLIESGESQTCESPETDTDRAKKGAISQRTLTKARKAVAEDREAAMEELKDNREGKPKAKPSPKPKAKKLSLTDTVSGIIQVIDKGEAGAFNELLDGLVAERPVLKQMIKQWIANA